MNIQPYSLEEVLQPRSVAILGASRAPQKWGHVAAKQLINGGFAGEIYMIAKGVKGIVVITAGFSETGPEGRTLEQQLVTRCREHGIRIIGSNCMGLYVARANLNALGMIFPMPRGPIGLVSQSGT